MADTQPKEEPSFNTGKIYRNLSLESYLRATRQNLDALDEFDLVAVHDQRISYLVRSYRVKDDQRIWHEPRDDGTNLEADLLEKFAKKVPLNAEAVVQYEISSTGTSTQDTHGYMYAGFLVIQSGIALVPRKKTDQ